MGQGEVGGGHQNEFRAVGIIHPDGHRGTENLTFKKSETAPADRDDRQCWTSGTPVQWKDGNFQDHEIPDNVDLHLASEVIEAEDGKEINMLASMENGKLTYHPLVQCYNQIMADLLKSGLRDHLSDLQNPTKALQLWKFLEEAYLKNAPDRIKGNRASILKMKARISNQ